jgi:hypothetical protein
MYETFCSYQIYTKEHFMGYVMLYAFNKRNECITGKLGLTCTHISSSELMSGLTPDSELRVSTALVDLGSFSVSSAIHSR